MLRAVPVGTAAGMLCLAPRRTTAAVPTAVFAARSCCQLPDFITEMEMAIISHGRASYVEISLGREARKMSLLSGAGTVLCRGVDVAGLAGTVPAAAFWRWGHLGVVPLAAPSGAPWGCWGGWQRPHSLFEPPALYSGPCSLPCPPGGHCKR